MQHELYQKKMRQQLEKWQRRQARELKEEWQEAVLILMRINLDPAEGELKKLYARSSRGRPAIDAIKMLRGWLLMMLLQYESITKFAGDLRQSRRLRIMAGFDGEKEKSPSVGSFYNFMDRLEDGAYEPNCKHRVKASSLRKGAHLRNLKKDREQREENYKKIIAQSDTLTQHLKDELLARESLPRPREFEQRLEDLLMKCCVVESAQRGLLGNLKKMIISGDGSALETGANSYGKPTCECRKQGIYNCNHDRLYRDPTANWGFDSHRRCFYFGHSYYQHVVSTNGHDLPLHVSISPASETDYTKSLKSLDRMMKAFSEHQLDIQISAIAYDSGHDAMGIYQFLMQKNINPVIALNERTSQHPKPTGSAQQVNADGVPICMAGLQMRRHGITKRKTIAYTCPVKRPTHQNGKYLYVAYPNECPLKVLCQPHTQMGPIVTVSTNDDPRHYPVIHRTSQRFTTVMNLRSGCERSNSIKKVFHKLNRRPCRCAAHFLFRLYLISMLEHSKAWLAEDKKLLGQHWRLLADIDKLSSFSKAA